MARWLYGLIATATAVVVGIISYTLTQSGELTAVYALLTWIVALTLGEMRHLCSRLEKKVDQWEFKVLNLQSLMPYLEKAEPYVREQVRRSLDEVYNQVGTAASGEIVLKPRTIQRDCIDLLKRVQSGNVFATSYIDPRYFWRTPEGALYRQHCIDLVKMGIMITRVFIEPAQADDEERKCLEEEIIEQKDKEIKVRRVTESSLPEGSAQDFLLIPDKYVAYLGVGARGDALEQLKICFSAEELKRAKELADEILTLSAECK